MSRTARFGRHTVELSNTDKVLFRDDGITKGDLVSYYAEIADIMLGHIEQRPLTLHRFPDGIGEDGFYQQKARDYFPDWIETVRTPRAQGNDEPVEHAMCNNKASLVYLANQATITFHGWLARAPKYRKPDKLVFDLDPPDGDFAAVRNAARQVTELMERIGLAPYAMTTGSRGLHVVAPLSEDSDFDEMRELAKDMAGWLAGRHPDDLTVEQRKAKRKDRLYLDVMRNAYGQTAVIPYSVRAKPGAPVATPISLHELGDGKLSPQRWTMTNVMRRLGQRDDPWQDFRKRASSVARARKLLDRLLEN